MRKYMTDSDINDFKRFTEETLMNKYHMTEIEAHRAIRDSYLPQALKRDPGYVDHDTVEEWADFIYGEIKKNKI